MSTEQNGTELLRERTQAMLDARQRVENLTRERDELRAVVAKVAALPAKWRGSAEVHVSNGDLEYADALQGCAKVVVMALGDFAKEGA